MARLTFRITYDRHVKLWLLCVLLSLVLIRASDVRALLKPSQAVDANAPSAVTYDPQGMERHVYLTDDAYYPDEALTACATGYHMASFWELLDVSNLTYDTAHPAAHTKTDSGYGLPSGWNGWVRTGWVTSSSDILGTGNCLGWSSRASEDYGVTARLSRDWELTPGQIPPWDVTAFTCYSYGPVWCVSYVYRLYLPMVARDYPVMIVENGGFELGLTGWVAGGDVPGLQPQLVTSKRHSGQYGVVLGQENAPCEGGQGGLLGESWIYQDIPVPASGTPQLSVYYRILTYDKFSAADVDRFEIQVDSDLLGRFGDDDPVYGCDHPISDLGWQQATYDLSAYAGQTVRLRLVNITAFDDWYSTWTYVDDIVISTD